MDKMKKGIVSAYMKKFILFCIFTMLIQSAGCSKTDKNDENTMDVQFVSYFPNQSMTDTVLLNCLSGIRMKDLERDVLVYACNKPGCIHEENSGCFAFPDKEENESMYKHIFVYNQKLYYFVHCTGDFYKLVCSDLEGTNKRMAVERTFQEICVNAIQRIDNKLYFGEVIKEENLLEDGYIDTVSMEFVLQEVDLDTGENRELIRFPKYKKMDIDFLYYSDGFLYYQSHRQTKNWKDAGFSHPSQLHEIYMSLTFDEITQMLGIQHQIEAYDLSTGDIRTYEIKEGEDYIGLFEDRLLFLTESGKKLISYNREMQDRKEEISLGDAPAKSINFRRLTDAMFFWVYDFSVKKQDAYYIWRKTENPPVLFELQAELNMDISIGAESRDYVIIELIPIGNTGIEERDFRLVKKEDFYKGSLKGKKVDAMFD